MTLETLIDASARAPRLRAIARDPETLYVYWDGVDAPEGSTWELRAEGPGGAVIATALATSREAWLTAPVAAVARVSVRVRGAANALLTVPVEGGGASAREPAAPQAFPSAVSLPSSSALLRAP